MDKEAFTRIGAGFYVDDNRALYFSVREFMDAHGLPDTSEVREAIWDQVRQDFGVIGITELPDT